MLSVRKSKIFYILTIVVFLANLVMPTIAARAEGEPPIDPTAEATTAPTDEGAPPAPQDPIVADPANEMTPEEAAQYIIPDVTSTPEAAQTEPVLAAVGENTEVVVLDDNGTPLPLATQAAADALTESDPRWCPVGVNPTFDITGCTGMFPNLTTLLAALDPTQAGVIWIETGTFKSGGTPGTANGENAAIVYNHFDNHNDLTFQGGWNKTTGAIEGATTFNVPLTIFWGGNLTLNNLKFTDVGTTALPSGSYGTDPIVGGNYDAYALQAVVDDNQTDGSGNGINKTLSVNGVTVTRSTGNGARFTADGAVKMDTYTLTNGTLVGNQFNSNAGTGLTVDTYWADVTLNDVTASSNGKNGAVVTSLYGDVTVGTAGNLRQNTFNNNGGTASADNGNGLTVMTDSRDICTGAYDWDAAANSGLGAWVWNRWDGAGDCNAGAASSDGTGLTDGWTHYAANISLNNIWANSNSGYGAYFQTGGYGNNSLSAWKGNTNPYGVWFQNPSAGVDFNNPVRYGEYSVDTWAWRIGGVPGGASCNSGDFNCSWTDLEGTGNDDQYGNYVTTGRGSITLTGTNNQFNSNRSVAVQNYASNAGTGADNSFGGNLYSSTQTGGGLFATTWNGDISLANVTANSNTTQGAFLRTGDWVKNGLEWSTDLMPDLNSNGMADISLTGINSFSNNQNANGFSAETFFGNINLNSVSANENKTFGASLKTGDTGYLNTWTSSRIVGLNTYTDTYIQHITGGGSINFSGVNSFSGNNDNYGLTAIVTGLWNQGDITGATGTTLAADQNGAYGAYLSTLDGTAVDDFSTVRTYPAANEAVHYYWGGDYGLGNLNLLGSYSFLGNGTNSTAAEGYGLYALADGELYLNSASADENGQWGATLLSQHGNISLDALDYNTFNRNGQWGGFTAAFGSSHTFGLAAVTNPLINNVGVTVKNVHADANKDFGAYLSSLGTGGTVQIWGLNNTFSSNDTFGLLAEADHYLEGYNLHADNNSANGNYYGADLNVANGEMFLDGTNTFYHNGVQPVLNGGVPDFSGTTNAYGLNAFAKHNIFTGIASSLEADWNTLYGAELISSNGGVYVYGPYNSFSDNGLQNGISPDEYGLSVESAGSGCFAGYDYCSVELQNTWADSNVGFGANLSAFAGDVKIFGDGSGFDYNGNYGLDAFATGQISLDQVWADENLDYGAWLFAPTGGVKVTNSSFNLNGDATGENGLQAEAKTIVSLNNVAADWNDGFGAELQSGTGDITITNSNFRNNFWTGLDAFSKAGNISLDGVTANDNWQSGAVLAAGGGTVDVRYSNFNTNQWNGLETYVDPLIGKVLAYHVTGNGNQGKGGSGFYFYGYTNGWASEGDSDPANVAIVCSVFNNNAQYGYSVDNVDGTLSVFGGETTGNPDNNYEDVLGSNDPLALFSGIVLDCQPVTPGNPATSPSDPNTGRGKIYEQGLGNGTQVKSTCDNQYAGLQLNLVPGDYVLIPCDSGKRGSALTIPASSLPEEPESGTVMSGLTFKVYNELGGRAYVAFKLAAGETGEGYSILFWDNGRWINIGGHLTEDGYFKAEVNQEGLYILVKN